MPTVQETTRDKLISLAKSAGLAAAGAAIAYVAQALPGIDFGPMGNLIAGALAPFLVNVLRKLAL